MNPYSSIYADWEKFWGRGGKYTPLGWYITSRKLSHIRHLLNGLDVTSCIDVGCGSGRTLKLLAELTGNAIGLDIAPTAVANCRAKGFRAFHEDFLTHSGVYDLVLSDGLIEHFEDFRPYVAGLCRLSGRYVMIIQTNHASFVTQILLFLERVIKPGINVPEYPHHVSAFIDDFSSHSFPLVGQRSILCGVSKILLFEKASGHTRND